jgi:C1A family cysteine protease
MGISNNFYYLSSYYAGNTPYYTTCGSTSNIIGYRSMSIYGTTGLSLLIRNSYGEDWGDNGYFWLYYTSKDTCNFGNYFSFNYW